jgi:hypothetical protein
MLVEKLERSSSNYEYILSNLLIDPINSKLLNESSLRSHPFLCLDFVNG